MFDPEPESWDRSWICWDPDNGMGTVMTGFRSEDECRRWMTRRAVSEGWETGIEGLMFVEATIETPEDDPK